MKLDIQGISFNVQGLKRAQVRELRKSGLDLLEKSMSMSDGDGATRIPFDMEEMETMLDIAFPNREDDLDAIGLAGRVQLAGAVFSETFTRSTEEEKN